MVEAARYLSRVSRDDNGQLTALSHEYLGKAAVPLRDMVTDIVVLATGFAYELPEAMRPLADRLSWDRDGFPVRADFSIIWDGPPNLRIYAQDAARHMRGVSAHDLNGPATRC